MENAGKSELLRLALSPAAESRSARFLQSPPASLAHSTPLRTDKTDEDINQARSEIMFVVNGLLQEIASIEANLASLNEKNNRRKPRASANIPTVLEDESSGNFLPESQSDSASLQQLKRLFKDLLVDIRDTLGIADEQAPHASVFGQHAGSDVPHIRAGEVLLKLCQDARFLDQIDRLRRRPTTA